MLKDKLISSKYLLTALLFSLLLGTALAEQQPCVVCSVEEARIHSEDCKFSTQWQGDTYYFYQSGCEERFLQDPKKWSTAFHALSAPSGSLGKGNRLPEFRFPLEPIGSLTSKDLVGKVLLLNFWATWCAPCLEEMPALVKLQEEFQDDGLVVVGLSFDKNKNDHRDGVDKLKLNFPSIFAEEVDVQTFLEKLGPTEAIPVTFIVDGEGNIVEKIDGAADLETFRKLVKPYLHSENTSLTPEKPVAAEKRGAAVPS